MKFVTKISTISLVLLLATATTVFASIPRKTQVSDNDTTPGYLNGKLVAGTGVSFVEGSDGGNETLTISASGGSGDVTQDQSTPQTIGATGARLAKLWATDITVTNAITGAVTGNAGTATALASNGGNCTTGNYPLGVDASGAVESCTSIGGGTGDVIAPATNTDNYVPQWDGTNSKTLKDGQAIDATGACASGSVCGGGHSHTNTDFKGMTIETPTDADNFFFFEAPIALTVTRVTGIVEAATSAVLTVQECDSAGDNCSTVEAVTADIDGTISTSIDNASIDAGDMVRVDVGTVTGTVGQAHITMTYTKND